MAVSDSQFAAFVDRVVACREAEDRAKDDTKALYAEISDAGEDKAAIGALVRELRMTAKDRAKANFKAAAVDDASVRYQRGKASHVRVREASIPEHDADGVIIEPETTNGGSRETAAQPQSHVNIPGRRQSASGDAHDAATATTGELQRQVEPVTHNEPAEGSAEETSAPFPEPVIVSPPSITATDDGDSTESSPDAVPGATNVTLFRTHNPETHFLNSKGLQRLHGCLNAEMCAGSRSKLCFTCSTQHEGPAHVGGAA